MLPTQGTQNPLIYCTFYDSLPREDSHTNTTMRNLTPSIRFLDIVETADIAVVVKVVIAVVFSIVLEYAVRRTRLRRDPTTKEPSRGPLTLRISGIPGSITKAEFEEILKNVVHQISAASRLDDQSKLSFAPAHSRRAFIATATIHAPPSPPHLQSALGKNIPESNCLRVDLDFFGLTPLTNPGENCTVE